MEVGPGMELLRLGAGTMLHSGCFCPSRAIWPAPSPFSLREGEGQVVGDGEMAWTSAMGQHSWQHQPLTYQMPAQCHVRKDILDYMKFSFVF